MHEFIANTPIQTRQSSFDKHERLLAFLSAEALNRIAEYQTGKQSPRVDLWNTVGTKSEKDWANANATQPIDYRAYHWQQIQARYKLLEESYGIKKTGRTILTDNDSEYQLIVKENIRHRIDSGDFVVRRANFTHCVPCGYIIAPVDAGINKCPICHKEDLDRLETEGLFAPISHKNRHKIIEETDIYPESARKSLRRVVSTLPDLIQLSKQRRFGIQLSEFGVDERFVLDPKIPLALMGNVVGEMGLGQLKAFVQGIDSIGNLAPYVYIADPNSHYSYVNIGLVPPFNKDTLNDQNRSFYTTFLPLIMVSYPNGIDVQQRLVLFKEFNRTARQFQYVMSLIDHASTDGLSTIDADLKLPLQDIFRLYNQYKTHEGALLIRQFIYESLSRDYLIHCREQRIRPNPQMLQQLKNIFSLVY